MNLQLTEYRDGDEDSIVELLNNVYIDWPKICISIKPVEYWCWKFLENPIEKRNCVLFKDQDKVVACSQRIPRIVFIFGDQYNSNEGADAAVDIQYRGLSLWTEMRKLNDKIDIRNHIDFTYFITGNPIVVNTFSKSPDYHRFPFILTPMVRILDIDKHLKALPMDYSELVKLGYKSMSSLQSIFYKTRTNTVDIQTADLWDSRFDVFWADIRNSYDFLFSKHSEYLKWRHNPSVCNITVRCAVENDRILGYTVLCINRYYEDYPIGYVMECLTKYNDNAILNALLHDANQIFDQENVNTQQILASNPFIAKCAMRNGYIKTPFQIHSFYNLKNPIIKKQLDRAKKVYFSWGDHDSLPVGLKK